MKRTQYGWVFFIVLPLVMGTVWLSNAPGAVLWPVGAIMAAVLLLCYKLTVTVDDEYVRFTMGIGVIRGKYRLDEIVNCRPISYFALGWGIRFMPGRILYNVSGNKAVELTLSGRSSTVCIGSDVPDELAAYINRKIMG